MAESIRMSSTEGGGNWWRVVTWAAEGFKAAGFDVELKRFGPHGDNTCARVARGESDVCATLRSFAIQAARGDRPFGPESKGVRGLALVMHPGHIFYAMLAKDTGIASFEELARRRPRLNLCVPGDGAGQEVVSAMLRAYGIGGLDEVRSWGGEFFLGFDEAAQLVLSGKADGILRENTRQGPAGQAASARDMNLLSLEPDIAARIGAEFGLDAIEIPARTFRNQSRPVIALQNGGYPMVCGAHLDPGLVYRLAKAIDRDFPRHYASEDIFYSPKHAPDTGCPLHPGAERYYREIGRLT